MKSDSAELRIPLYLESNEVNLSNGTVVFKIATSEQVKIQKINRSNKTFYITITTNGIETVIYDGKVSMLANTPRTSTIELLDTPNNSIGGRTVKNIITISPIKLLSSKYFNGHGIMDKLQKNALNPVQLKRLL